MARLLLLLSAAILVVPSANLHRLDGLPLSTGPELVGLTLLVPFAASRALRRAYAGWLRALGGRLPPGCRAGLVCLALLALAVKLGLLAAGAHAGFLACYRSPAAAPPAGACERSYENPFARFGVTRLDRAIDFGPTDWDLSFVNSVRFNFYPWVAGTILRERLPLDVSWQGVVEHARPLTAQVTYVGAATLGLDGVVVQELPPH